MTASRLNIHKNCKYFESLPWLPADYEDDYNDYVVTAAAAATAGTKNQHKLRHSVKCVVSTVSNGGWNQN